MLKIHNNTESQRSDDREELSRLLRDFLSLFILISVDTEDNKNRGLVSQHCKRGKKKRSETRFRSTFSPRVAIWFQVTAVAIPYISSAFMCALYGLW